MSFIDKFLDLTAPIPRRIVRILKLYRTVEERSDSMNSKIKILRHKYLQNIKTKDENTNENIELKNNIDNIFQEILNLSDYKQELIKELKYILENSFLKKMIPIIEEGEKECKESSMSTNVNTLYGSNTYSCPISKSNNNDFKGILDFGEKKKKNDSFLEKKKNRGLKNKKKIPGITSDYIDDDVQSIKEVEKNKQDIYCKCKRPSFGEMIQCEQCQEWFHFECVKFKKENEPKEWYCDDCKNLLKKSEKIKKKKKVHS